MPTKPLLLEGMVHEGHDDPFDADLRKENARLGDQVLALRRELEDANRDKQRLERSIENLRTTLNPLHRAFRALFGEIELAVGEGENNASLFASGTATASQVSAEDPRWRHFKDTFGGTAAEIIDALLIHGELKLTNLVTLIHHHYNTVQSAAVKLRAAGAINYSNGVLSLKR
jgi:hypothetical protein